MHSETGNNQHEQNNRPVDRVAYKLKIYREPFHFLSGLLIVPHLGEERKRHKAEGCHQHNRNPVGHVPM